MAYQERIPRVVYRLRIKVLSPQQVSFVEKILEMSGVQPGNIIVENDRGSLELMVFQEDNKLALRIKKLFTKLQLKNVVLDIKALKPDDWVSKWKRGWKPARLTKELDVVPIWHRKNYKPKRGRGYIIMDTLMSFGTGLHETTRIVAQFIEDHRKELGSFFDIGTGTGILTLVALKHGAGKVLALDIGELSIQAANKNAKVNRVTFNVICEDISRFKHSVQYDFVAANLVTHDLIAWRKNILRFVKPDGLLAVSGISLDNWTKFKQGFIAPPLILIDQQQGKQWAGALFRKQSTRKM